MESQFFIFWEVFVMFSIEAYQMRFPQTEEGAVIFHYRIIFRFQIHLLFFNYIFCMFSSASDLQAFWRKDPISLSPPYFSTQNTFTTTITELILFGPEKEKWCNLNGFSLEKWYWKFCRVVKGVQMVGGGTEVKTRTLTLPVLRSITELWGSTAGCQCFIGHKTPQGILPSGHEPRAIWVTLSLNSDGT